MWPKCEECNGTGKKWEMQGNTITDYDFGPCPACNGTGEAAELTADQADKYLRGNGYEWRRISDGNNTIIHAWQPLGEIDDIGGQGETLTAALNAAAQAVKERGKR